MHKTPNSFDIDWDMHRYIYGDLWIDSLDILSQEQGNENMDKKFLITETTCLKYKTYEEAENDAKKYTARNDRPYAVLQAISMTKEIVPEIEVVKL